MAVYSELLKELRKDQGLTQKAIGAMFGIAGATYSLYENGHRRMTIEMLCKLADILNTSTDYLLGRTDRSTPYPRSKRKYIVDDWFDVAFAKR